MELLHIFIMMKADKQHTNSKTKKQTQINLQNWIDSSSLQAWILANKNVYNDKYIFKQLISKTVKIIKTHIK